MPVDGALAFALDAVRPNPSPGVGGSLTVNFALAGGEPARLELIDSMGRRMASRDVGVLGAGRHAVDLATGRRLTPGVYFVRLTQGRSARAARVALLR